MRTLTFADSEKKNIFKSKQVCPQAGNFPSCFDPVCSVTKHTRTRAHTHTHTPSEIHVGQNIERPHTTRILGIEYVLGLSSKQTGKKRMLNLAISQKKKKKKKKKKR